MSLCKQKIIKCDSYLDLKGGKIDIEFVRLHIMTSMVSMPRIILAARQRETNAN